MTGFPSQHPDKNIPLVIPEENHPIRPHMIDSDAVFVMRKLNKAGFSSYLVGGGVRDLYLGKTPKDFDISTDARPGQIRKLFPNSSTIGRRFRLVQVFFKSGKVVEVSTLRSLSEHDLDGPETLLAPNNTYGNLPEDAQRRDLSINSLFYELENKTIIDYIGGVSDLDNSIIRIVGKPDTRISRDPVRMMRAIRHSARTGFKIEKETWCSIKKNHGKILLCPPSRIRDELFKDLYGGSATRWLDLMVKSELLLTYFPFYQEILFSAASPQLTCHEMLQRTFFLFDTLNASTNRGNNLPKSFILSLLLLPWAEHTYNLSNLRLKGPGYFQLSKSIRREIDKLMGIPLNLRKSLRQEMVTLLCNLPQFVRFVQNNNSPRWLKKKSYYANCLFFHEIFTKIIAGPISQDLPNDLQESIAHNKHENSREAQFSKRKTKPAFSPKNKGSIFGFRK